MTYFNYLAYAFLVWLLSLVLFSIGLFIFTPPKFALVGTFLSGATTIIGIIPGAFMLQYIDKREMSYLSKMKCVLFSSLLISNVLAIIGLSFITEIFDDIYFTIFTMGGSSIALILSILRITPNIFKKNSIHSSENSTIL
ncbi:MAG: hypothetical protein K1X55_11205 [Chitinophagales bacterium]|nr:hypothetical protein [Chitinophagales bacterium]